MVFRDGFGIRESQRLRQMKKEIRDKDHNMRIVPDVTNLDNT